MYNQTDPKMLIKLRAACISTEPILPFTANIFSIIKFHFLIQFKILNISFYRARRSAEHIQRCENHNYASALPLPGPMNLSGFYCHMEPNLVL